MDLGRLLQAGHFQVYTDFMYATSCEQFDQSRSKVEELEKEASLNKKNITATNDKID